MYINARTDAMVRLKTMMTGAHSWSTAYRLNIALWSMIRLKTMMKGAHSWSTAYRLNIALQMGIYHSCKDIISVKIWIYIFIVEKI